METEEKKAKPFICYGCEHRGSVPGDAHSCCKYPGNDTGMLSFFQECNFINTAKLNIKGNQHGISSGWFMWPVNFDPIWLENCDGFKEKECKKEMPAPT